MQHLKETESHAEQNRNAFESILESPIVPWRAPTLFWVKYTVTRTPCGCEKRRKVKVKLADGKERTLQRRSATTFWSPQGQPISAAEFVQRLCGELPELFRDEDQLRELLGNPEIRKALLAGLQEKGFGGEQLRQIGRMVDAENSDLYDALAYIAFSLAPVTCAERVDLHRQRVMQGLDYTQREFLSFVLDHYVQRGVGELDIDKLPHLIELKYNTVTDAVTELGPVKNIREVFVGFQRHLY